MPEQSKHFSRRQALKLGLLGAETLALGKALEFAAGSRYDPTFKIEFDGDQEHLSFSECAQLAKRFDRIYDALPEERPAMTQEDLQKWALEVIPMFEYEGFVSPTRWPEVEGVGFAAFPDGDSHNHVLGRSNCGSFAVLNFRAANEHSSWFEDDDDVVAFIHELAHVQQGASCQESSAELVENTAQIMMLEVASALVNQGNTEVLPSLVSELRGMALSSAYAAALKENALWKYRNLRGELSPGALSRARFEKGVRRWVENPSTLMGILERYNVQPLLMAIQAIRFHGGEIGGLALPELQVKNMSGYYMPRKVDTYTLDDLAYFLAHAEEIAKDAGKDWPPKKG